MSARVLTPDELDVAANLFAAGEVLGIPTDTVYGLAAALDHPGAVRRLSEIKRRPSGMPIAVLCAGVADAARIAATWSKDADALATAFWPGPLHDRGAGGRPAGSGPRFPWDSRASGPR